MVCAKNALIIQTSLTWRMKRNNLCKMMSIMAVEGELVFLHLKDIQIYVNFCKIVNLLARFLQCNSRNLKDAEGFKYVFVVYFFVLIEIDQLCCVLC